MHNVIQSVAMLIFKMKKADIIPVSSGVNTIDELFDDIIRKDYKSVFIASGKTIRNKGMLDRLTDKLNSNGVKTCVFSDIVPDPTIENVEAGLKYYKENKCSCIIAAGGGSVLDCAKVIALRAANPLVSVAMMAMYVVPCRKSVPLYAVPTTSGTGSEITFFSVITDTKKKKKLAVLSDKYMPEKIIFDYELLRHVPENPTVYAGMDALTHSIEAYISTYCAEFSSDVLTAPEVCRDIFHYLPIVKMDPDNIEARLKMAEASYKAGLNFRRTSVGYVHAIAHRLGETYHIPHGLACAVVLPHVLKKSIPQAEERLHDLALKSGLADSAENFINKIIQFEKQLGISGTFDKLIESDFPLMIKRAVSEASLQGCPAMLKYNDVEDILNEIKQPEG